MNGDAMQRLAVIESESKKIPELEKRTASLESNFILLTKELETVAKNLIPLTASLNKLVSTLNASKWVAMGVISMAALSVLGIKGALLALLGKL